MKSETTNYFSITKKKLRDADKLMEMKLYEDAARNSYLAGMNAVRGLLFEDGFKATKRHKTLYGALSKALHDRGIHDPSLTSFLPTVGRLKAIADYETGEETITKDQAAKAIERATDFVEKIRKIAATPITAPHNRKRKKPSATL